MKISGFSFIRNAVKYDYPVREAIRSILPLCDDVYIALGKSEDNTIELIENIDPKIHIIKTVWNDELNKEGRVLAEETNKAFRAIPDDRDWCFYIQGDEVVHEKYLKSIFNAMEQWKDDQHVDGLLFNYLHFFGSYDYIATAPNWYRKEIRIIRKDTSIYSYRDAQGFRKGKNRKLMVKPVDAYIYHYGWVRHPEVQLRKHKAFHRLYHEGEWADPGMYDASEFDYSIIDEIDNFHGTHPEVMLPRIKTRNWTFDRNLSANNPSLKNRFKRLVYRCLGFIPGEYRNYRIIR